MEDYESLDSSKKYQVLSRWFLTSLANSSTPSACDPEIAQTLAAEPCQARPIAELLHVLDSSYFTDTEFLPSIQHLPMDTDYRIKCINLQRVITYTLQWYEEVQNKTFTKRYRVILLNGRFGVKIQVFWLEKGHFGVKNRHFRPY